MSTWPVASVLRKQARGKFQMPGQIVLEMHRDPIAFGKGKVAEIDKLVPAEARVLIVYGGTSAKKNGTLDEVKAALGGRYAEEFSGIEPNPTYETLMKAVSKIKANKLDYLLAVGGGSVIDGTKFVAAAVYAEGDPWEILLQRGAKARWALNAWAQSDGFELFVNKLCPAAIQAHSM